MPPWLPEGAPRGESSCGRPYSLEVTVLPAWVAANEQGATRHGDSGSHCPTHRRRSCLEELLPALAKGELGESTAIITHRLPLLDGVRAYEAFEQRLEGWMKVVFDPWTGGKPASESV